MQPECVDVIAINQVRRQYVGNKDVHFAYIQMSIWLLYFRWHNHANISRGDSDPELWIVVPVLAEPIRYIPLIFISFSVSNIVQFRNLKVDRTEPTF